MTQKGQRGQMPITFTVDVPTGQSGQAVCALGPPKVSAAAVVGTFARPGCIGIGGGEAATAKEKGGS